MPQNSHSFKEITDIVVSKCKVYNIGRDSGWTLKEESGGLVLSTKGGNIRIFLDGDYIEFHGSGKFSSFSEFVNNDLWYMQ